MLTAAIVPATPSQTPEPIWLANLNVDPEPFHTADGAAFADLMIGGTTVSALLSATTASGQNPVESASSGGSALALRSTVLWAPRKIAPSVNLCESDL
jgi:hypothetical protein